MSTFKWGILATGTIANNMAQSIKDSKEAELVAVGSRSQASAEIFGEHWEVPGRHGSYEALVADPAVEVVYIASPHSHHYQHMLLALNAGKHVLCEKAFTLNATQARECIELAREKELFLMEAMWARFFPAMVQVRAWLDEGRIGEVRLVQADFCVHIPSDPKGRVENPVLGGGALLDLGIYPLSLASMVLGAPDDYQSHAHLGDTGVDVLNVMQLEYDRGASAQLASSMRLTKPREAFITGTAGFIKIHEIFYRPVRVTLAVAGEEAQTFEIPYASNGYIHEVEEVHACLRAGQLESAIMPLDETLALLELMDSFRKSWGLRYPQEET